VVLFAGSHATLLPLERGHESRESGTQVCGERYALAAGKRLTPVIDNPDVNIAASG